MGYRFSVEKFKENFNAKDITDKSIDSVRITHRPDGNFQVFPYGTLLKGESFCLKLDNDDMVAKVSSALKHLAEENKIIGIYTFEGVL